MLCVVVHCVSIWAFALSLSATQARKYLGKDFGDDDDDDFSVFSLPSMGGGDIVEAYTHTQAGRRCRQQEESYITRGNSVFNSEKTQHQIDYLRCYLSR
jgi:hypothetical protein